MGRPPLYDWDRIFSDLAEHGSVTFVQGQDFQVSASSFRGGLQNEAQRRGIALKTLRSSDGTQLFATVVSRATYPWDDWLDGNRHVLQEGRDFRVQEDVFRRMARRVASVRGLKVECKYRDGMLMVEAMSSSEYARRHPKVGRTSKAARWAAEGDRLIAESQARIAAEDAEFAAYEAYVDSNALESQTP